jgi:hypothetical protein
MYAATLKFVELIRAAFRGYLLIRARHTPFIYKLPFLSTGGGF